MRKSLFFFIFLFFYFFLSAAVSSSDTVLGSSGSGGISEYTISLHTVSGHRLTIQGDLRFYRPESTDVSTQGPARSSLQNSSVGGESDTMIWNKFVVESGSELRVGDELYSGDLRIEKNTVLVVEDGASLYVGSGSQIVIEEGGALVLSGSSLVETVGLVRVEAEGYYCLEDVSRVLLDENSIAAGSNSVVAGCIGCTIGPPQFKDEDFEDDYFNRLVGVVGNGLNGGLTYEIPLSVAPGSSGVAPQLSIVYTSSMGDGLLGIGMNLSGLSSIGRVGSDFYHEGNKTGVKLTDSDHYALDGSRLILNERDCYDAEQASFSDITPIFASGYLGPKEFVVKTKEGGKLYYGQSPFSRIEFTVEDSSNFKVVYQWLLSKVEDASGNYMIYTYNKFYALVSISYTGNTISGRFPYNEVRFLYGSKQYVTTHYVQGHALAFPCILEGIEVYSEGNLKNRYCFLYDADKKYLQRMIEYSAGDTLLGDIRFDWKKMETNISFPPQPYNAYGVNQGWSGKNHIRTLADVNGDGLMDIVGFGNENVTVGLSMGNSFSAERVWFVGGFGSSPTSGSWTLEFNPRYVIDVNGDGFSDIVGFSNEGVLVALSNGEDSFGSPKLWIEAFGTTSGNWMQVAHHPRYMSDFNGDGLPDIIGFGPNGVEVGLNTAYSFQSMGVLANFEEIFTSKAKNLVGDINGDGLVDIVRVELSSAPIDSFFWAKVSNGYGFEDLNMGFDYPSQILNRSYLIDMTGDGKADFVYILGTSLFVCVSTGRNFKESVVWFSSSSFSNWPQIFFQDVNGDGLVDVATYGIKWVKNTAEKNLYSTNRQSYEVLLNCNGERLRRSFSVAYPLSETHREDALNSYFALMGDVAGKGLPSLLVFWSKGVHLQWHMDYEYSYLSGVSDDLGPQFRATYGLLTDSSLHRKGVGSVYPVLDFSFPLVVCKEIKTRSSFQRFQYEGARIHLQGRGFLGFSKVESMEDIQGVKIVQEFGLNGNYMFSFPKGRSTYLLSNGFKLSEQVNGYHVQSFGPSRFFLQLTDLVFSDFVTQTQETTNYTYDYHGNIVKTKKQNGTSVSEEICTYVAVNSPILNRLSSKFNTIKNTASSLSLSERTDYTYNTQGLVFRQTDRVGTPIAIQTNYSYFPSGMLLRKQTVFPDAPPQTENYSYDPKERFLTLVIGGLGRVSKTYDFRTGNVLSETDMGGRLTTYTYNVYGRLKRIKNADGQEARFKMKKPSVVSPLGSACVKSANKSGSPTETIYYDTLDRPLRKLTKNPSGFVLEDYRYNNKGQLIAHSQPYFQNATPVFTTFMYDPYGRKLSESLLGLTTSHVYEGLRTTVVNPSGRRSTKTYNAGGDLIRSIDEGGQIHYSYDIPGLVKKINILGSSLTELTYDVYGRKIAVNDPNAGTLSYTYNSKGDILTQTDAKGVVNTNTYDQYDRLINSQNGQTTTDYRYVNSGPNKGQIEKISNSNGSFHAYTYDSFGRVLSFEDKMEESLFTHYTYNAQGRLSTYQYPSGYKVQYVYNGDGYLIELKEFDTQRSIWRLTEVNAMGQELRSTYIGQEAKESIYNPFGQLLSVRVSDMLDLRYTYDFYTGNMIRRYDAKRLLLENFEYDHLDRLISGITYADNGNILYKSGVGSYSYHPSKKHAVTEVYEYTSTQNQFIAYNAFHKVERISQGDTILTFNYGPTQERQKMTYRDGRTNFKRIYSLNYEVTERISAFESNGGGTVVGGGTTVGGNSNSIVQEYIFSPYGLVAIRRGGILVAVGTDHLGSIVAEKSRNKTIILQEYRYDAWGWNAVKMGAISTAGAVLGFVFSGVSFSQAYLLQVGINGVFGLLPSIQVPITENLTFSMSVGVSLSDKAFGVILITSFTYRNGDLVLTGGFGSSSKSDFMSGYSIGLTHKGYGGAYHASLYGNAVGLDGLPNPQLVGGVTLYAGEVSFRLENDFFGDGRDRWRTNAWELSYKNFSIGSLIYTNDPNPDNLKQTEEGNPDYEALVNFKGRCPFNGPHKKSGDKMFGVWIGGEVHLSSIYIGYRNRNQSYRIGLNMKIFQQMQQNWIHNNVSFGNQNYYIHYDQKSYDRKSYGFNGYYNPYSLW